MTSAQKDEIRVGSMFWDGKDKYYKVTYFNFSNAITYEYGEPIESNIVHVDIYADDDFEMPVDRKNFLHIQYLQPVPISEKLLKVVEFQWTELDGKQVLLLNNAYFNSLTPVFGFYTITNRQTKAHSAVQFVHDAQRKAAY